MQTSDQQRKARRIPRYLFIGMLGAASLLVALLLSGYIWWKNNSAQPRLAPEAEQVLKAQIDLPFQALIPAYLPAHFDREKVEIQLDQTGPHGEQMLQLAYPTPKGNTLVLQEWLPKPGAANASAAQCRCVCASRGLCSPSEVGLQVGALRVAISLSAANLLTYEQLSFVLDTLGPAANQQVFSRMEEVPVTFNVPPAVEIPVNASGIQEVTLVVMPEGYTPPHFAVKKGTPVRLVFRQLGQVGCGNELVLQWGKDKSATLTLASASDKQTLEFTPEQAGDFRFSCPHLIYRGVMTVQE
jgi:hypothetical protein